METKLQFTFTNSQPVVDCLIAADSEEIPLASAGVVIHETANADYSSFTWSCAVIMAQFIWHNRKLFQHKHVLEISSGTGLPGILAAKVGTNVILSEHTENALVQCRKEAAINNVHIDTLRIVWGQITREIVEMKNLDYIILSDVFYEPANFADILSTIQILLRASAKAQCFFTYQVRDDDWNIHHLLRKFGMDCEMISLEKFEANRPDIAGSHLPGSFDVQFFRCFLRT